MTPEKHKPGYCHDIDIEPETRGHRKRARQIADFVHPRPSDSVADIGKKNTKSELLKKYLDIEIDQVYADDFNFDTFQTAKKYDVVFCFEVLEHLQNPLWFLKQVKGLIKDDGIIYLSTPYRIEYLWSELHFHEMSHTRIQRWLLSPLGLKILRKKRMRYIKEYRQFLIGIRPIFRLLTTFNFAPILNIFFTYTFIYEIRHER